MRWIIGTLLVVWLLIALLGFLFEGLIWLAIIGIILFVVTVLWLVLAIMVDI